MAFLFKDNYDVEICTQESCVRDIYGLIDLPYALRDAIRSRPRFSVVRWRSPDGSTWLVRPVLG